MKTRIHSVKNSPAVRAAFGLYNLCWGLAIPLLKRNRRIREGFFQRTLSKRNPAPADIWIQGASAGECFLSTEILRQLNPKAPVRILFTAGTRQGIDILRGAVENKREYHENIQAAVAYFPFDRPALMERAVAAVHPKVMVLLETEIWPGLLAALKGAGIKTLLLNGRITEKSLNRYRLWPSLWPKLAPDRILAICREDADRFDRLFGQSRKGRPLSAVMPNIKFDRITAAGDAFSKNPLATIIPPEESFIVLGSVRQEEEPDALNIIRHLRTHGKSVRIGLFPRHMERLSHWEEALGRIGAPWVRRSELTDAAPPGHVVLWDTFGELSAAYALSRGAFVGGSLVPLGGQNFLEPLACGVVPVIGPHWKNFSWVGENIVKEGLLRVTGGWEETACALTKDSQQAPPRARVREKAMKYLRARQGGTRIACRAIIDCL